MAYILNDASRTRDVKYPGTATERETPSDNVLVTFNYHMEKIYIQKIREE